MRREDPALPVQAGVAAARLPGHRLGSSRSPLASPLHGLRRAASGLSREMSCRASAQLSRAWHDDGPDGIEIPLAGGGEGKLGQPQWSRRVWGEGLRCLLFGAVSVHKRKCACTAGWVCAALPSPSTVTLWGQSSGALAHPEWGKIGEGGTSTNGRHVKTKYIPYPCQGPP